MSLGDIYLILKKKEKRKKGGKHGGKQNIFEGLKQQNFTHFAFLEIFHITQKEIFPGGANIAMRVNTKAGRLWLRGQSLALTGK